jgi:hypothetical protein
MRRIPLVHRAMRIRAFAPCRSAYNSRTAGFSKLAFHIDERAGLLAGLYRAIDQTVNSIQTWGFPQFKVAPAVFADTEPQILADILIEHKVHQSSGSDVFSVSAMKSSKSSRRSSTRVLGKRCSASFRRKKPLAPLLTTHNEQSQTSAVDTPQFHAPAAV